MMFLNRISDAEYAAKAKVKRVAGLCRKILRLPIPDDTKADDLPGVLLTALLVKRAHCRADRAERSFGGFGDAPLPM